MLSIDEFNSHTVPQRYKLYKDSHEELVQYKERTITLMEANNDLLKKVLALVESKVSLSDTSESKPTVDGSKETYRSPPMKINDSATNLILGSSIVSRLPVKDLPQDVELHAYGGSSTLQKIDLINKYEHKEGMKTFTLQDGTNALLRNPTKPVSELYSDYETLVSQIYEKFTPEKILLVEVPPVFASSENDEKNHRINEFNAMMKDTATQNSDKYELINIHETLLKLPNAKTAFFDELHLNFQIGLPTLRNCIMKNLSQYSDNIPRPYVSPPRQNTSHVSQRGGQFNGRYNAWNRGSQQWANNNNGNQQWGRNRNQQF